MQLDVGETWQKTAERFGWLAAIVTELKEHGAALQIVGNQLQTVVYQLKQLANVTEDMSARIDDGLKKRVEQIQASEGRRQ